VNQRHEGQYSSVFILLLFDYEDARKKIWVIVKSTKVTLRYFIYMLKQYNVLFD